MKKGYTLVELLGVIMILALVCALVFPSLINFIKKTNEDQDELTTKLILNQVELFIKDNPRNFKSVTENTYCISVETLIENNYLSGNFELDGEDITNTKSIKATYTNKFNYEIVNSDDCIEIVEGEVPSNIQLVEYIESTGTQYIDTGFTPNQDTRVVVDFQYRANTSAFLFGARRDSGTAGYTVNISSGNCVTSYGNTGNVIYGTYDGLRHTIDKNKNVFSLDGVEKISSTAQNFEAPGTLEIFASYQTGAEGYLPSNARIYSFKIYDNDVLVRYFIPCYRKLDNVGGLYDIVNKVFYTSSVGEPFVVGPNVEE